MEKHCCPSVIGLLYRSTSNSDGKQKGGSTLLPGGWSPSSLRPVQPLVPAPASPGAAWGRCCSWAPGPGPELPWSQQPQAQCSSATQGGSSHRLSPPLERGSSQRPQGYPEVTRCGSGHENGSVTSAFPSRPSSILSRWFWESLVKQTPST